MVGVDEKREQELGKRKRKKLNGRGGGGRAAVVSREGAKQLCWGFVSVPEWRRRRRNRRKHTRQRVTEKMEESNKVRPAVVKMTSKGKGKREGLGQGTGESQLNPANMFFFSELWTWMRVVGMTQGMTEHRMPEKGKERCENGIGERKNEVKWVREGDGMGESQGELLRKWNGKNEDWMERN